MLSKGEIHHEQSKTFKYTMKDLSQTGQGIENGNFVPGPVKKKADFFVSGSL